MKIKEKIFITIYFVSLLFSYFSNSLGIVSGDTFSTYDLYSEALVIGKLIKSDKDGVFSSSGFTGVYYAGNDYESSYANLGNIDRRDSIVDNNLLQINYYLSNEKLPKSYYPYISNSGGQAIFYSVIGKILPFDNNIKLNIYRFINALLIAFIFSLFLSWIYRNYGILPSFITFILILFSYWLLLFSCRNAIWWSLWSFYVPFIIMLLLLEKKHLYPDKIKNGKIFCFLFLAVFIKCLFTGFEFISTSLSAIYCSIIYYFYIDKEKFSHFLLFSFKAGLAALSAILLYSIILIIQLKFLMNSFEDAIQYFFYAYERRSFYEDLSIWNILSIYLGGNAFDLKFIGIKKFHFLYVIFIIFISCLFIYLINRKTYIKKYTALVLTTVFSIVCPLSWYILFQEHASGHLQLDFIVWYIPFLFFGFLAIGVCISQLITNNRFIRKQICNYQK